MMWRSVPTDEIVLTKHSGVQRDLLDGPDVYTNVDVKRSLLRSARYSDSGTERQS